MFNMVIAFEVVFIMQFSMTSSNELKYYMEEITRLQYISLLEMDNPPINEETLIQFVFDVASLIT